MDCMEARPANAGFRSRIARRVLQWVLLVAYACYVYAVLCVCRVMRMLCYVYAVVYA